MWPLQRSFARENRYITACELSVIRLSHLSGICFIDDHEIIVRGLPLRFSAQQLVPNESQALYISLLISMIPDTAVLWSYGVEFLPIVWPASFNSGYFLRIGKKVIKSYVWNIIFWISTTQPSRSVGDASAVWCVQSSLPEILHIFVTGNIVIIHYCD